jgi:hypothetical protein
VQDVGKVSLSFRGFSLKPTNCQDRVGTDMRESIWGEKTTRVFRTLLSTNAPTRGDPTALSANCMLETRPANRNEQNPIGYFSLASVCPQYYY